MRHLKILGLCVAAVSVLAVVLAAGSASAAEPEWGVCLAQKHGRYTEGNCQTAAGSKENKKTHVVTYKGKYEWKSGAAASECVAKKKGDYLTSACNTEKEKKGVPEEHKGKYEKLGPKFTGEGGAGILDAHGMECEYDGPGNLNGWGSVPREDCSSYGTGVSGKVVECEAEHASGEAVGTDEVANVSVRFTGCTAIGLPATSSGQPAGVIVTNTLKGRLGYINKAAHEVGVLLEPAAAGGLFAEFYIDEGALVERVGEGNATEGSFYEELNTPPSGTGNDGIISPIVPVNQMTHTFTQNYRVTTTTIPCRAASCEEGTTTGSVYQNVPSRFEGGPLEALEFQEDKTNGNFISTWSASADEVTNVNTDEGEAEIKA